MNRVGGKRDIIGVVLVLGAAYVLYVYDTGRFSLLKAAVVGPPGVTPLMPGLTPSAAGGFTPITGSSPQVYGSTPMIAPPGASGLPPALPSSAYHSSDWLGSVQSIIASIWGSKSAAPAPGSGFPAPSIFTPPITAGGTMGGATGGTWAPSPGNGYPTPPAFPGAVWA